VSVKSAQTIRAQVKEALSKGAKALIDGAPFRDAEKLGENYLAPQVLVDVDHSMQVMMEETLSVNSSRVTRPMLSRDWNAAARWWA